MILKEKFDDAYDKWIKQYLEDQIKDAYKKKDILAIYETFKKNQGQNKGLEETEEKRVILMLRLNHQTIISLRIFSVGSLMGKLQGIQNH